MVLATILEKSGKLAEEVEVVIIPEFLGEGSAVYDFYNPSLTLVGTVDGEPSAWKDEIATLLVVDPEEIHRREYREAELMKSICNVFHALKVSFGTRWRRVPGTGHRRPQCDAPADARPQAQHLAHLLRPRDALRRVVLAQGPDRDDLAANQNCVNLPLLRSIRDSNQEHVRRACEAATQLGDIRRVGLDGLAFKGGIPTTYVRARRSRLPSICSARVTTCESTTRASRRQS